MRSKILYWVGYILMMVVIISYYILVYKMYEAVFTDAVIRYIFLIWAALICTIHLIIFNYLNLNKDVKTIELNNNLTVILGCIVASFLPPCLLLFSSNIRHWFNIIYKDINWLLESIITKVKSN